MLCPMLCPIYVHHIVQLYREWQLSPANQKIVDERSKALAQDMGDHYPHNMRLMSAYGQYKCVTWTRITASKGWAYVFEGLFPPEKLQPLLT